MAKKDKKVRNLLKKKKKQDKTNKKSEDFRVSKQPKIRKMNGWRKPMKNWEHQVSGSVDKLINQIKKEHKIDEDETEVLTEYYIKRVRLYEEIAEITGVSLIRGEFTWAMQYEYLFQEYLYKEDTTTEASRRNVNTHNLKYLIEQTYNRDGNPNYEELKLKVYEGTDVGGIPETNDKTELQKVYYEILEKEVEELRKLYENK